jgi:hypothetical protein
MKRYLHESGYHHSVSHYQQTRFKKRFKKVLIFIVFVLIAVSGYLYYDSIQERQKVSESYSESGITTSTILGSSEVFQTSFFQFQAPSGWVEVGSLSRPGMYVYRKMNQNLIQQDLTIYVDNDPDARNITYIAPVSFKNDGSFDVKGVFGHCEEGLPEGSGARPTEITYKEVTFTCAPGTSIYTAAVGQVGKNLDLALRRPDGERATYHIVYRNVTVSPDGDELLEILKSFRTR